MTESQPGDRKTPTELGLEAAFRLQKIELLEWKKKYWYERYCYASSQLEHTKAELEQAIADSRGRGNIGS